jgi:ABC-type sugar transport system ATPase subunit
MKALELKNISKSFGVHKILNNISIDVSPGEFLVLVGPSGCGKSTLLRIISGLESISDGQVIINGKDSTKVEPQNRDIAMVFQSYALYPHMNVFENMAFSLRIQKLSEEEIKKRIHDIADLLQMTALLDRKPKDLSGGQRQRVSLGRALVRRAPVILFDEPLSNLDAHLRNQMRIEIKKIHQHFNSTIVYVTHDQTEAMTMGDRIAVLNKGSIEQIDTPYNIYHTPNNTFVANFIGTPEINLFDGHLDNKNFLNKDFNFTLDKNVNAKDVVLGFRPESIKLTNESAVRGKVIFYENLGPNGLLHVNLGHGTVKLFVSGTNIPRVSDHVFLDLDQTKMVVFDKNNGNLIQL